MPAAIYHPGYRNEGIGNLYPFADDAVLRTDDGLEFDPDVLLDAAIYPAGLDVGAQLTAVTVAAGTIVLTVGDRTAAARCAATFDPFAETVPAVLALQDALGRAAGVLVCDPAALIALRSWPAGTHTFAAGAARFVASVTVPSPQVAVTGIATADGGLATGGVWLVGEGGVTVTRDAAAAIRIDVVGDPLSAQRVCGPSGLFRPPTPIRALRFVDDFGHTVLTTPDAYGNIAVIVSGLTAADTVLRISPVGPETLAVGTVARAPGT